MLRVEAVDTNNRTRFIHYAAEHGSEHDDSYLPGPGFEPSPEHPGYLLLRDDVVIGAASLMRTPRYLQAGRSRFSIFHSTDPSVQTYSMLFAAIHHHFDGLQSVYLFLPESRVAAMEAVRQLGFSVERYSYVMMRSQANPEGLTVPQGYALRPVRPVGRAILSAVRHRYQCQLREPGRASSDACRWPARLVHRRDLFGGRHRAAPARRHAGRDRMRDARV